VTGQATLPTPLNATTAPTATDQKALPAIVERLGGRRWALTDLGFVVAAAAATVVMVLNPTSSGPTAGVPFRFDDLGGGSSVIRVFRGVKDTPADRVPNGTFFNGQTTTALCKTRGRRVTSDPSVGERPRASDVSLQVMAQPGKRSFVPLT
jgi:hypothetical protein